MHASSYYLRPNLESIARPAENVCPKPSGMLAAGHKSHLSSLLFKPQHSDSVINVLNASVALCSPLHPLRSLVSTAGKGMGSSSSLFYRLGTRAPEGLSAADMQVMKARPQLQINACLLPHRSLEPRALGF